MFSSLGPHGAERLGQALRHNPHLRILNVASTGLTSVGCAHLAAGLTHRCALAHLDVGFNDIRDAGCMALAMALGPPSGFLSPGRTL